MTPQHFPNICAIIPLGNLLYHLQECLISCRIVYMFMFMKKRVVKDRFR